MRAVCWSGLLGKDPKARRTHALHYIGPQKKPAAGVSLRAIDPERYAIIDESQDGAVLEEIEESKAFYEVYDGAVYMYQVCASLYFAKGRHSAVGHMVQYCSMLAGKDRAGCCMGEAPGLGC